MLTEARDITPGKRKMVRNLGTWRVCSNYARRQLAIEA